MTTRLFVFGCSLSCLSVWPQILALKHNLELVNLAVPAGDNVTQCRRFIDLFLHNKISSQDIILWEVTYLDRMGFRLRPDHPFYQRSNKVKNNLHKLETNIFDNEQHSDYVAFNHEWYDVWYYLKNEPQTLQELVFTLIMANNIVHNKCLIWFAQNNLFEDNHAEIFCKMLNEHDVCHLDYETESMMSWLHSNNLPLGPDNMHPTEAVYKQYVDKFIDGHIERFCSIK